LVHTRSTWKQTRRWVREPQNWKSVVTYYVIEFVNKACERNGCPGVSLLCVRWWGRCMPCQGPSLCPKSILVLGGGRIQRGAAGRGGGGGAARRHPRAQHPPPPPSSQLRFVPVRGRRVWVRSWSPSPPLHPTPSLCTFSVAGLGCGAGGGAPGGGDPCVSRTAAPKLGLCAQRASPPPPPPHPPPPPLARAPTPVPAPAPSREPPIPSVLCACVGPLGRLFAWAAA
jgi:hypothetical protein